MSRNHAVITRGPEGTSLKRPGQPQRHLRQPAQDRGGRGARGRRRAADRQIPTDVPARVNQPSLLPEEPPSPDDMEGAITIGAVCDLLKADYPVDLDLQDPLPRGPAADHAQAHRGRLPALQPARGGAPADDPAPAARRVPAPAGDPPGAGVVHDRGVQRRQPGQAAQARPAGRAGPDAPLHAAGDPRHHRRHRRPAEGARGVRPGGRARRRRSTRPTARWSRPPSSSAATGSSRATCACSAWPPSARPGCCSSCWPWACARATPSGAARRSTRWRAWPPWPSHMRHLMLISELREIANP